VLLGKSKKVRRLTNEDLYCFIDSLFEPSELHKFAQFEANFETRLVPKLILLQAH
jgi:hypothetical protein